jgi:hypothetical protein
MVSLFHEARAHYRALALELTTFLIDDIFDILEGEFDELNYVEANMVTPDDVFPARLQFQRSRAAVATLTALMRQGIAWSPAEDGHEATVWRSTLLDALDPDSEARKILGRELDELVALAASRERRAIPARGTFEALARRAHVDRMWCAEQARRFDDLEEGWIACEKAQALVRIPIALGIAPSAILSCLSDWLRDLEPVHGDGPLFCERATQRALNKTSAATVRNILTTPELRALLAAEKGA